MLIVRKLLIIASTRTMLKTRLTVCTETASLLLFVWNVSIYCVLIVLAYSDKCCLVIYAVFLLLLVAWK